MPTENLTRYAVAPALFLALACGAGADPLSKKADIDFYRDVLSRDLHGMASRSDGRLVIRRLTRPGVDHESPGVDIVIFLRSDSRWRRCLRLREMSRQTAKK